MQSRIGLPPTMRSGWKLSVIRRSGASGPPVDLASTQRTARSVRDTSAHTRRSMPGSRLGCRSRRRVDAGDSELLPPAAPRTCAHGTDERGRSLRGAVARPRAAAGAAGVDRGRCVGRVVPVPRPLQLPLRRAPGLDPVDGPSPMLLTCITTGTPPAAPGTTGDGPACRGRSRSARRGQRRRPGLAEQPDPARTPRAPRTSGSTGPIWCSPTSTPRRAPPSWRRSARCVAAGSPTKRRTSYRRSRRLPMSPEQVGGRFVVALDGHPPALAGAHGQSLDRLRREWRVRGGRRAPAAWPTGCAGPTR